MKYVIVIVAAFLAGIINSVAGGGTLLTFPSLLAAGISSVAANATSTVALVPASISAWWGYRGEGSDSWKELAWLSAPSLAGGLVGALLVLRAGDSLFSRLVPWLILGATVLFIVQEPLRRWMAGRRQGEEKPAWPMIALFQLIVAVYGGFFGAGIGIMMLASLGLAGMSNIHHMNRLKNFAAVCINGVAALTFIFAPRHQVDWLFVTLMLAGSIPGGYAGAWVARKVGQTTVKRAVIVIGLCIGAYMLKKQLFG